MALRTCFHCGSPVLDTARECPSCQADLSGGVTTGSGGITSSTDWERYEVPWFDLPLAFSLIRDPADVSHSDADRVMRKYAGRSLVLSAVALVLSFVPMFFFGALLPAVLGLVWALAVVRIARAAHRRTARGQATAGFALGLLASANVALTILINLG